MLRGILCATQYRQDKGKTGTGGKGYFSLIRLEHIWAAGFQEQQVKSFPWFSLIQGILIVLLSNRRFLIF